MKKFIYLALGVALFASCKGNKQNQQSMLQGNGEFAVETVSMSTADLYTKYTTTIKGIQDVEIRPKVTGNIVKQCVDEGDFVHAGQVLFVIDDTQYQAAVDQARGAVRQAESAVAQAKAGITSANATVETTGANINVAKSQVSNAQLNMNNKNALLERDIISKYDHDVAANQLATAQSQLTAAQTQQNQARAGVGSANAALAQAEAMLSAAQAGLRAAQDQLSYCQVRATSNGVIGAIPFRVGALVSPSIQQPLCTVSNLEKMYAYFSMTEKQFLELSRACGTSEAARQSLPDVSLILADGTMYSETGKVTSFSGMIDAATGSVQMRATFNNPDRLLRSGATGVLRFPVKENIALMIPQKATYEIQDKKFVYLVGSDNKVKSTEIKVLDQNNGESYVVTSGLKEGDRIVVEGITKLKDGQAIKPISVKQSEAQREKSKQHMADKAMPGQD